MRLAKLFMCVLHWIIGLSMSIYDGKIMDSDLSAFKNSGVVRTASITFSGSVGAGASVSRETPGLSVASPDFAQILFDNSYYHSGKWKSMALELQTLLHENTSPSELVIVLGLRVVGSQVFIRGDMFNPYSYSINIDAVTINFRYMPYEATI
jgi:hypothetical protein